MLAHFPLLEPDTRAPNHCVIPFDLKSSLFSHNDTTPSSRSLSPSNCNMTTNQKITKPNKMMVHHHHVKPLTLNVTVNHSVISVIGQPVSKPASPTIATSPSSSPSAMQCSSPSSPSSEIVFKPYIPHLQCKNTKNVSPAKYNNGPWTEKEHEAFLLGFRTVGRQWKTISQMFVKTRDRRQVSSHAQKYFRRLKQIEEEALNVSHQYQHNSGMQMCATQY